MTSPPWTRHSGQQDDAQATHEQVLASQYVSSTTDSLSILGCHRYIPYLTQFVFGSSNFLPMGRFSMDQMLELHRRVNIRQLASSTAFPCGPTSLRKEVQRIQARDIQAWRLGYAQFRREIASILRSKARRAGAFSKQNRFVLRIENRGTSRKCRIGDY